MAQSGSGRGGDEHIATRRIHACRKANRESTEAKQERGGERVVAVWSWARVRRTVTAYSAAVADPRTRIVISRAQE